MRKILQSAFAGVVLTSLASMASGASAASMASAQAPGTPHLATTGSMPVLLADADMDRIAAGGTASAITTETSGVATASSGMAFSRSSARVIDTPRVTISMSRTVAMTVGTDPSATTTGMTSVTRTPVAPAGAPIAAR